MLHVFKIYFCALCVLSFSNEYSPFFFNLLLKVLTNNQLNNWFATKVRGAHCFQGTGGNPL